MVSQSKAKVITIMSSKYTKGVKTKTSENLGTERKIFHVFLDY